MNLDSLIDNIALERGGERAAPRPASTSKSIELRPRYSKDLLLITGSYTSHRREPEASG